MSPSTEKQIERLKTTIAEMEAQRDALGDRVVQKAVEPLYENLEELNRLLAISYDGQPEKLKQQRKLVTILFMDIVGSTSLIQHMDPEDVSEAFDAHLKRLAWPVEDYSGRVTSFMGDGFLAVFGAPTARSIGIGRAVLPTDVDLLVGLVLSLAGLPSQDRERIITQGSVLEVQPGNKLKRLGEVGDSAYFVLQGKTVAGIADDEGGYHSLSSMGPGDYFGEIAALTGAARTADVVAEDTSLLLKVQQAFLGC